MSDDISAAVSTSSISIVILFGYNGSTFDGLERTNGPNSIEQLLFKAISAQYASGTTIKISHISRASPTHKYEHAVRNVISMDISGSSLLPKVELVNSQLTDIVCYSILETEGFSARRMCEARTVEFVFPTYAFAPPPEVTEYCYGDVEYEDENDKSIMMPTGGMFKTGSRKMSMRRRPVKSTPNEAISTRLPDEVRAKKKGFFARCIASIFGPKKMSGSEKLKMHLSTTLSKPKKKTAEPQVSLTEDLKRTLSRKRDLKTVIEKDIVEQQEVGRAFEPLNIPSPEGSELDAIKSFRLDDDTYQRIVMSLALFNGTHNFHNYIPGSVSEDKRCFVAISNIESKLHIHNNVEWIRVKVEASAFARGMVNRMMAMLILTIRTGTPRSVISHSFGYQQIDIPEPPPGFYILDEPHYNSYNAEAMKTDKFTLTFSDLECEQFKSALLAGIFAKEEQEFKFEEWLRELDNYSFMYTYFLNVDGLIRKPVNYPIQSEE